MAHPDEKQILLIEELRNEFDEKLVGHDKKWKHFLYNKVALFSEERAAAREGLQGKDCNAKKSTSDVDDLRYTSGDCEAITETTMILHQGGEVEMIQSTPMSRGQGQGRGMHLEKMGQEITELRGLFEGQASEIQQLREASRSSEQIEVLSMHDTLTLRDAHPITGMPEDEQDFLFVLQDDTFSLMMFHGVCSKPWLLGFHAFTIQMCFVLLIFGQQASQSFNSTPFNIPFKVDIQVIAGQVLAIPLCLWYQVDVLTSIQTILAFWNIEPDDLYKIFANHQRLPNRQQSDRLVDTDHLSWKRFMVIYILLPNLLKFLQGVLVIVVSMVVIVQSDNMIDLLKDFTALFFVSEIDNIVFDVTRRGYFGQKLAHEAEATMNKAIPDKSKRSFIARSVLVLVIGAGMMGCLVYVTVGQESGKYFAYKFPDCDVTGIDAIQLIDNDVCDGGVYNTIGCKFDGGDCIDFNIAFPNCKNVNTPSRIGDGVCDGGDYNIEACGWDGGDCPSPSPL